MSYVPEPGHVIVFSSTHDSQSMYYVNEADDTRVKVSPVDPPEGVNSVVFDLSLHTFREMGGTPLVLTDEEMLMLESLYAVRLVETLGRVQVAMTAGKLFGPEIGALILPVAEIHRIEEDLNRFKASLDFLRAARANADAAYDEAVATANGR